MRSYEDLIAWGLHPALAPVEKSKLLEALLRSTARADLGAAARQVTARWSALGYCREDFLALLRALFDEVALSPYTDFVDKTLIFLRKLSAQGYLSTADLIDFLGYLLRHLARHLTAYDLLQFHHRGANYPDALLLDAVLKTYLDLAETHPAFFGPSAGDSEQEEKQQRMRRRALRQGWLLRRFYEGLPVPATPTSPGENARILPPPHVRVPEEEIDDPSRRSQQLFATDPLIGHLGERGRALLRRAIQDLQHPLELRELGMAVFLDRPFGVFKATGEPDHTLLTSCEAFSRTLARRRLGLLGTALGLIPDPAELEGYRRSLDALSVPGLPPEPAPGRPQLAGVSLQDALKAADDFLLLRTTRKTVADVLALFDFSPLRERFSLDWLSPRQPLLMVYEAGGPTRVEGMVVVHDALLRRRLELRVDPQAGYASRGGLEYPAGGLQVLRVWQLCEEHDLRAESIHLPVRE